MNSARPELHSKASLLPALELVGHALASVPATVDAYRALTDAELPAAASSVSHDRDSLATVSALLAGEVAHRSRPELGSQGLAQRTGYRTAEEFVKVTTRASGRDAVQAVKAGTLLAEAADDGTVDPLTGEVAAPTQPWLAPVAAALAAGELSLSAADAIRSGLGSPNSAVNVQQLRDAASRLCVAARSLDPDRLARRAREARTELDAAGVAVREEERREQRSLRVFGLPNGMGKLVWTMDPETFASVKDLYDRATSPKLGGVRFVGGDAKAKMEEILADSRTPEQLGSDSFLQLLIAGADADSSTLIGSGAPIVKLTTTLNTLESLDTLEPGAGRGYFEGQVDAVSIATVERHLCGGSSTVTVFDHNGQPLDHGHEQRLFTKRQKAALAIRDGGCRWTNCDRPPSWSEAHHILWWGRDAGPTDVRNGILLCKHHHLLLHNNGWDIIREPDENGIEDYWLIPPPDVDPQQKRIAMPSKSAAMNQLRDESGRVDGGLEGAGLAGAGLSGAGLKGTRLGGGRSELQPA
jgi:hypothetical protein